MRVVVPQEFWERLADSERQLLMLDYDGTLAPHRSERDQAMPYPGVLLLLEKLVESSRSRIVIISGRGLKDLTALLPLNSMPECWGSHGLERLVDGELRTTVDLTASEHSIIAEAETMATGLCADELRIEHKPFGLAFHWRGMQADEAALLRRSLYGHWKKITAGSRLSVFDFDGGLEIRPGGFGKGSAVEQLVTESGRGTVAAYLGDDLTDEHAFCALKEGLTVLVRTKPRYTHAKVWLKPPLQLLEFLNRWSLVTSRQT